MAGKQQGKRGKSPDTRPARGRYWMRKRLQHNKVGRIMRNTGWDETKALAYWLQARSGRRIRS